MKMVDKILKLEKRWLEPDNWVFTNESRSCLKQIFDKATRKEMLQLAEDIGITSCVGEPIPYLTRRGWRYGVVNEQGSLEYVCVEMHLRCAERESRQQENYKNNHHLVSKMNSLKIEFDNEIAKVRKEFWEQADIHLAMLLNITGAPDPIITRMLGTCPNCGKDLAITSVEQAVDVLCLKTVDFKDLHSYPSVCAQEKKHVEMKHKKKPRKVVKREVTKPTELYIQELYSPFFKCLKVGISNNTSNRKKQQEKLGMFKHNIVNVFKFDSREEALEVESKIKSSFERSLCLKEWLPDGFTETFKCEDYESILDMCRPL